MSRRRVLPPLLFVCVLLQAQSEDIYQRVRQILGGSGEAALRAKNFASVEEGLEEMKPANDDDRAEVMALRGAVDFLDGKMAHAVADFRESEKIRPLSEKETASTLAMALVRLGDEPGARGALNRLASGHANTAIYRYWLGRLDYDQRRYKEAVENLEQAVILDPAWRRASGTVWDQHGICRGTWRKLVKCSKKQ